MSWRWLNKRTGLGFLVFNLAMLFWFYWGGVQTYTNTGEFVRQVVAITAWPADYLGAMTLVNLFYFLAMVGYMIRPGPRILEATRTVLGGATRPSTRRLIFLTVFLFFAGFGFYLIAAGGPGGVLAAALGSRGAATAWDSAGNFGTGLSSLHYVAQAALVICSNLALLPRRRP